MKNRLFLFLAILGFLLLAVILGWALRGVVHHQPEQRQPSKSEVSAEKVGLDPPPTPMPRRIEDMEAERADLQRLIEDPSVTAGFREARKQDLARLERELQDLRGKDRGEASPSPGN